MFLTIKEIPKLKYSSANTFNLKPKSSTLFFLCFGQMLFGLGEGLLIVSATGASPWNVLHEGIAINTGITIGTATFITSFFVLLLWFFLRQKPGIGTFTNFIIISIMIDVCVFNFNAPELLINKYILAVCSILLVGLGGAIYLIANLGPGPRDGLMTGLQKKTGFPIAWVRACLEITVVTIGWFLGGTAGIGTVLFAFGIGPSLALFLHLIKVHIADNQIKINNQ